MSLTMRDLNPDFTPSPEQVLDLEILFGDLLYTGHSVLEAASFVIRFGHGDIA